MIKITVILRANFQMTLETDTNGLIGDLELILIETLDGETTIEIGQINKMVLIFKSFTKGQLILKCPFGVFKSPKKPTKIFPEFLP